MHLLSLSNTLEMCVLLIVNLAFSINYFVGEDEMTVDDPNGALKVYEDKKSVRGDSVKVKNGSFVELYSFCCL